MTASGFKFDLVPAPNFSQNQDEKWRLAKEKLQAGAGTEAHLLSPAFTEQVVSFVKKYTDTNKTDGSGSLMRQFIRLVKLWNKLALREDVYISGRSYMFELIAIHVWEEHRNERLQDLFLHFLNLMKSFHSLSVEFHNAVTGVDLNNNRLSDSKSSNDALPIILDPSNVHNDLGAGIDEKCVKIFEREAIEWRNKLWQMVNGEYKYNGDENLIQEFVSSWRSLLLSNSSLLERCEWLVMVCKRGAKSRIRAPFLRRQKRTKRPRSSPGLLLLLELVLYRNPRLANAYSKDDMEEAVKAILADLSKLPLQMERVPSKSQQLSSSSPTLSSFRKCSAHLEVVSSRGIKAIIGYRVEHSAGVPY